MRPKPTLGNTKLRHGRRYVYTLSGWKLQHRIEVEKSLGRELLPTEIIIHNDGNKLNNEPSNLSLSTKQEHGSKVLGLFRPAKKE